MYDPLRPQKPFPGNWDVGSTPTFGTNFEPRIAVSTREEDSEAVVLTATVTATAMDGHGQQRNHCPRLFPYVDKMSG